MYQCIRQTGWHACDLHRHEQRMVDQLACINTGVDTEPFATMVGTKAGRTGVIAGHKAMKFFLISFGAPRRNEAGAVRSTMRKRTGKGRDGQTGRIGHEIRYRSRHRAGRAHGSGAPVERFCRPGHRPRMYGRTNTLHTAVQVCAYPRGNRRPCTYGQGVCQGCARYGAGVCMGALPRPNPVQNPAQASACVRVGRIRRDEPVSG